MWLGSRLWCRPVAIAPIQPLALEPPHATGAAQEIAKRQKKKKIVIVMMAESVICHCISPNGVKEKVDSERL